MAMKRANGTGSVYKMKHKKLRKPYRAMVFLGQDSNGKTIRKTIGTFATQKEAYDAIANYVYDPMKVHRDTVPFYQCWDWMLLEKERQGVDIKKGKFDAVKPKLSSIWSMPIKDIRLIHLQNIIDQYKHLGRSSHDSIYKAINGAFKEAIKNDIITKNYALDITLPPAVKSNIHKPFTPEEISILWQHTDDILVRVILIYIYTGMRPVELYQVKLENVNLKEQYVIGGSKTVAGKDRMIPLADCIMPFIKEIYSKAHFSRSETLLPPKLIPTRLSRPIERLCESLGLSKHKPHDTRHTFITLARNADMDIYILKSIVGHTHNGDVTSDVYTHKTRKQFLDAVNTLPVTFTEEMMSMAK